MRLMWMLAVIVAVNATAEAQVVGLLRDGVYRFDLDESARDAAPSSVVFAEPASRDALLPVERQPSVTPSLSVADGRFTISLADEPGTTYYGGSVGQHRLARNGLTLLSEGDPLPWAIAVRPNGSAVALLVDGPAPVETSFEDGIRIDLDGPARPVILIEAPHPAMAAMGLQQIVGAPNIPEKWVFGLHHVLPAETTPEEVIETARVLRARDIPGDVLWVPAELQPSDAVLASVQSLGFRVLSRESHANASSVPNLGSTSPTFGDAGDLGPDRSLLIWQESIDGTQAIASSITLGLSGFPYVGVSPQEDPESDSNSDGGWLDIGPLLPLAFGVLPSDVGRSGVGEATQRTLLTRMVLMPHLYTAAYQAHQVGVPIVRPIMFEHIDDPDLRGFSNAFMLGNGLAIARTSEPFDPAPTGEPANWKRFDLRDAFGGTPPVPGEPTLWIRAGHVVTTGPLMEYVDEAPPEPLTLYVNLDERGAARGYLYEDAGTGAGYTDEGSILTIYGAVLTRQGRLQILRVGEQGERERFARTIRVIWITDDGWYLGEGLDGSPIIVDPEAAVRVGP